MGCSHIEGDGVGQQVAAERTQGHLNALPSARFFGLNQTSGQLSVREGVPPGSYHLQVRVSDRTWPDVTSTARVDVRELQRDALKNAASVRLNSESRQTAVDKRPLSTSSAHLRLSVQM